jgi:cytochrome b561
MLLVYGRNGERLYSAAVFVSADLGRSVKIYGQAAHRRRIHQAAGLCRLLLHRIRTCSRADKDKPPAPPVQTTITRPVRSTIHQTVKTRCFHSPPSRPSA